MPAVPPWLCSSGVAMRHSVRFGLTLLLVLIPVAGQAQSAKDAPPKSGFLAPAHPRADPASPLYMQADQVIHDTQNSRVIAQGNVEMYYNNFILTADQVIYDRNTNKLIAEGNAQLKDPNGSITRADRFEALDDFRDAFVQSLSLVTQDDTRIIRR